VVVRGIEENMTEPKTIRVKRHTITGRFEGAGLSVRACNYDDADELDITINPVKSLKQQRREARGKAETHQHVVDAVLGCLGLSSLGRDHARLIDAIEAIYRGER